MTSKSKRTTVRATPLGFVSISYILCLSACQKVSYLEDETESIKQQGVAEEAAPLPPEVGVPIHVEADWPIDTLVGEPGDCDSVPDAPSACEWAGAADFVVLGEVDKLEFDSSLKVVYGGKEGWHPVKDCDLLTPALKVRFRVLESFKGELTGEQTFWIGASQVKRLEPAVRKDANGEVAWERSAGSRRSELLPGMKFVVALHSVEDGRVSLMGEAVIGVGPAPSKLIAKPNSGDCLSSTPLELDNQPLAELRSIMSQCGDASETKISDMKNRRQRRWTTTPAETYAAQCDDGDPTPSGLDLAIVPGREERTPGVSLETRSRDR